jgi:hypothetical protein
MCMKQDLVFKCAMCDDRMHRRERCAFPKQITHGIWGAVREA